jgi:hypothetical protein
VDDLLRRGWRVLRLEVTLYVALVRWLVRRPAVPVGSEPVGYAQLSAPVMGLWIFASAAEIPLVHLLVPWEVLRLVLLVVSVWGLVWMLGMYAGLRTYPHLVTGAGLRLRYSTWVDVELPWSAVRGLRVEERDLPSSIRILQRTEGPDGSELHVAVAARTNVTASLEPGTVVRTGRGPEQVASLSFWVDEPRTFVRSHMPAPRPPGEG